MISLGSYEVLLIIAVFVVICGVIAYLRGRSVVAWAILGFLFGPLALVLVLLLPRGSNRQQKVSNSPAAHG
jgi:membrane protein implicated in regulation of membrane protease activity